MNNRWMALVVLCCCVFQFTLNWFCVVPAFPAVAHEYGLSIPQVAGLVAAFVAGYGICHLPAGWLSARIGMRRALLTGVAIQAIASLLSTATTSYEAMLAARVVAGAGGACCLGAAVGLVSAWFGGKELSFAMGMTTGVAFALGAGMGLFLWALVVAAIGWRSALVVAGVIGLGVLFVAWVMPLVPSGGQRDLDGGHLSLHAVRRVLSNGPLWMWGMSIVGSYGAFFTTAQFVPIYAERVLHLSPPEAGRIGALLLLSGIPAAMLGGWISDRFGRVKLLICGAFIISGIATVLLPRFDASGLQAAAIAIGLITMIGLTPWFSMPAMFPDRIPLSDVPAASGLMLSLAAMGGFVVPLGFGHIVATSGFSSGWIYLGIVSIVFTVFGLFAPSPKHRRSVANRMQTDPAQAR
ncbi:MFS transporter [Burkholderia pseudomultivorans]|uniref:Sulfoacetate transporter SauU n=2 Tax=Burkholderia pseudomultivorans TaxID=1207504 RepID=A0ABU2DX93_9BURK|nr:MFS transporter [Burkholderia pseudomultivorans]MDR8726368.1 putative sulfoacetate transporter SauU [Burkholderia pseudomultivorans]MDR8733592.1 putative sulfoacetate transporter SauU [Burkholderia pseudomultivorans]MDR8740118.1 putative sulfoacetate transporter SauU [Burkholderia pseudomultivorans]MDR8752214.1 putative sulfoacetate transporter SauU [Burkholderia pseudomultivorans]MDR8776609.1 putative sulfoacetate transporter SauU [Burkholderia pseudomultivorans]